MTNPTVSAIYADKYTIRTKYVLKNLGGDPDAIIAAYQDRVDHPEREDSEWAAMFGLPVGLSVEDAAQNAYWDIVKEIERLHFSRMSRTTAVEVANLLCDLGSYCIIVGNADLTYNYYCFALTWNKCNPDKEPLRHAAPDIG